MPLPGPPELKLDPPPSNICVVYKVTKSYKEVSSRNKKWKLNGFTSEAEPGHSNPIDKRALSPASSVSKSSIFNLTSPPVYLGLVKTFLASFCKECEQNSPLCELETSVANLVWPKLG